MMKFWRLAVRPTGSDTTFRILKKRKWCKSNTIIVSTFSAKGALMLSRSDCVFHQTKVFCFYRGFVFGRIVRNFRKLVDMLRFLWLEHNLWGVENPRRRVAAGCGQVATGRKRSLNLQTSPQDKSRNFRGMRLAVLSTWGDGKVLFVLHMARRQRSYRRTLMEKLWSARPNSPDWWWIWRRFSTLGSVTDLKPQFYRFVSFCLLFFGLNTWWKRCRERTKTCCFDRRIFQPPARLSSTPLFKKHQISTGDHRYRRDIKVSQMNRGRGIFLMISLSYSERWEKIEKHENKGPVVPWCRDAAPVLAAPWPWQWLNSLRFWLVARVLWALWKRLWQMSPPRWPTNLARTSLWALSQNVKQMSNKCQTNVKQMSNKCHSHRLRICKVHSARHR